MLESLLSENLCCVFCMWFLSFIRYVFLPLFIKHLLVFGRIHLFILHSRSTIVSFKNKIAQANMAV